MTQALLGLGSNMGERAATLRRGLGAIRNLPDTTLLRVSRFIDTSPVGGYLSQGRFLNAAAVVETALRPEPFLSRLLDIEADHGRERFVRWGPRTLDLDLLLYGEETLHTDRLTLPHPRMAFRRFVLEPAVEIAPRMVHPELGWSLERLLRHLNEAPPYVAITGSIGAGKSCLLGKLADSADVQPIREELDAKRLRAFYAEPAREAWETECMFLDQRTRLLDRNRFALVRGKRWAFSDFWFDQSDAFAQVWLTADRYEIFHEKWLIAREHVVAPKLVVLLKATPETLEESVRRRNRPYESGLSAERLEQIQEAIEARLTLVDQGPRLVLEAMGDEETLREVHAAIEGMDGPRRGLRIGNSS